MTRIFTTIKRVLLLLVLVSLTSFLKGQAPIITCSGITVTHGDQSTNDPLLWNAAVWWDPLLNSKDMAENAVPLEITITDTCTASTLKVKYVLYLDLDNNGSQETRVDSDTLPAANTIHYNNNGLLVTAGEQRKFDFRPIILADKYRFDLLLEAVSASERKAQLVWRSSATATSMAQLPHGTHKIKWQVANGCGQQSTCEYTFIVRDDQPPTVTCINGLQFNFGGGNSGLGSSFLWASDFLNTIDDNLTPGPMVKLAIRKSGTGTGFPTNADGTPQTGVIYNCLDKGINTVELWAKDKAGNTAFCEAYFLLKDGNSYCWIDYFIKLGIIKNELDQGIEDVSVLTENYTQIGVPFFPIPAAMTSMSGYYHITNDIPYGPLATIRPVLELDPLNGVNIWDLILISRHILGLTPLVSPYKLISADANQSGTVTTFDIVELRKLILGTYTKLPNNSSWRFVDKTQVFTNPENPFADTIRSYLPLATNIYPPSGIHIYFDFTGTKIGDVDNTAIPNGFSAPTEDRTEKTTFMFQDQNLQENEVVSLHFAAASNIEGYQMTLDLAQFELLEIIPQNDLTMDNFAVFEQALTMVTEQPNQGFDLRLRAKQAGQLSSMLAINDKITRSVAFDAGGLSKGIALHFNPIQKEAIQLNQNVPNPWHSATNIRFYLPEANTPVTFTVVDEIGRVVYTTTNTYAAGYQSITLDESMLPQAGMYWYSLTTSKDKLVQKMVKF
jgi:hypothetical protein